MKHIKLFNESFQDKENPGYWSQITDDEYRLTLSRFWGEQHNLPIDQRLKISKRDEQLIDNALMSKEWLDKEFKHKYYRSPFSPSSRSDYSKQITRELGWSYKLEYRDKSDNTHPLYSPEQDIQIRIYAIDDDYFLVCFLGYFDGCDSRYYKCDQIEGLVDLLEQLPK